MSWSFSRLFVLFFKDGNKGTCINILRHPLITHSLTHPHLTVLGNLFPLCPDQAKLCEGWCHSSWPGGVWCSSALLEVNLMDGVVAL